MNLFSSVNWKKLIKSNAPYYLALFLVSLISLTWSHGHNLLGSGDVSADIDTVETIRAANSSWNDSLNTGHPETLLLLRTPTAWLLLGLRELGFSRFAVQKLWTLVATFMPGLLMFIFLNEFLKNKTPKLLTMCGALFYVFNPITMITPLGLKPVETNLYMAIPLLSFLVLKILELPKPHDKLRYCAYFILATTFMSNCFLNIAEAAPLFIIMALLLLFKFGIERTPLANLKYIALILMGSFLLNFWWINSSFRSMYDQRSASIASLGAFRKYSRVFDAMRLLGFWALIGSHRSVPYYLFGAKYYTRPFVVLTYLIPVLVALPMLLYQTDELQTKKTHKLRTLFSICLFFLGVFLVKGGNKPFGEWYNYLYENYGFFKIFRESYSKFNMLSLVGATLGLTFCLTLLHDLLKPKLKQAALVLSAVFLVFVRIIAFPMFTGENVRTYSNQVLRGMLTVVPQYWDDMSAYINHLDSDTRIMPFPRMSLAHRTHLWPKGHMGIPTELFIRKPKLAYREQPPTEGGVLAKALYDAVDQALQAETPDEPTRTKILNLLRLLNVGHILQVNDFDWLIYKNFSHWSADNTQTFLTEDLAGYADKTAAYGLLTEDYLKSIDFIRGGPEVFRAKEDPTPEDYLAAYTGKEGLVFYDLSPELVLPKIFSPDTITTIDTSLLDHEILTSTELVTQQPMILENAPAPENTQPVDLTFHKISPAKYKVTLGTTPTTDVPLVFSESYDPQWKLYKRCGILFCHGKIENTHYHVNYYANGWIIPKNAAPETLYIYNTRQNRLKLGIGVSLVALAGTLGGLVLLGKRPKKSKRAASKKA